jgi:hypothetical protein
MLSLFSEVQVPPSISNEELQSSLVLHVTLVRQLNLDYSVRIPIVAGHCLKPGWKGERESEFDELFPESPPEAEQSQQTVEPEVELELTSEQRVSQNWYNKAVTFRDAGEIEQAINAIEKSLKWDPDFDEAIELREALKSPRE